MINAQKLHREFIRLGGMRHKLKNRMLAILPEIYKSGVYKKYAGSIVEYAGKFGDIAKTTVIKRLRLEKNLENKPYLKAAIEKVGVHKVALVAKIATFETDKAFAENISNMSRAAVQSLSKELRCKEVLSESDKNGCEQMNFMDDQAHVQTQPCHAVPRTTKIELDEESTFLLMKLKAKLGKHLSDQEFLKLMLKDQAQREFPTQKNVTGDTFGREEKRPDTGCHSRLNRESMAGNNEIPVFTGITKVTGITKIGKFPSTSRYIPADKKRQIIAQTNGKCSYPNCNSPFQVLHHVDRFSLSKSHNSVIPLCKIHHEFSHNNLIQNENLNMERWRLSVAHPPAIQIARAEILYKKYHQKTFA